MAIPVLEMIERYEKIYTGAISDILDERGEKNFGLPHTFTAVTPRAACHRDCYAYSGQAKRQQRP